MLIIRCRDIISNISEGTAFLLKGVTENDSSFKRYKFKRWEIRYNKQYVSVTLSSEYSRVNSRNCFIIMIERKYRI